MKLSRRVGVGYHHRRIFVDKRIETSLQEFPGVPMVVGGASDTCVRGRCMYMADFSGVPNLPPPPSPHGRSRGATPTYRTGTGYVLSSTYLRRNVPGEQRKKNRKSRPPFFCLVLSFCV